MAVNYICDGCGKQEPASVNMINLSWIKPERWFQRGDEDGVQDACSRECIEVIAKKTGKTKVVLPF